MTFEEGGVTDGKPGTAPTERLTEVLEEARRLGFLGPGPVAAHLAHAGGFAEALAGPPSDRPTARPGRRLRIADLGSGGGVPGLPLLLALPDCEMMLLEASQKRCSFLVWATVELGVADRAEVRCCRAEKIAHEPGHREDYDVVVARGFGPPASTIECGGPLLRVGGRLLVSEPPGGRSWPATELADIGLAEAGTVAGIVRFVRTGLVPSEMPRPVKEQRRRPLFDV